MQELWYRPIVLLIVLAGIYFTVRTNRVFSQNLHNDTDVSFLFNRCGKPLRRAYAAGILMQAGESICFPFMIMLRMAIAAGGAGAIVWFAVFSLLLKCVQGAMARSEPIMAVRAARQRLLYAPQSGKASAWAKTAPR